MKGDCTYRTVCSPGRNVGDDSHMKGDCTSFLQAREVEAVGDDSHMKGDCTRRTCRTVQEGLEMTPI